MNLDAECRSTAAKKWDLGAMRVALANWEIRTIATLPPTAYTEADIAFIEPRVLELTYTSRSLKPWAQALGYAGEPFGFDENRRGVLKAELDVFFAKKYGLTEEEFRYILDPKDVKGEDFPSESFRTLRDEEIAHLGEYRTKRLALEAWVRMEGGQNGVAG